MDTSFTKVTFKTHTCFKSLQHQLPNFPKFGPKAIPVETDDEVSTPGTSEVQNRRLVGGGEMALWEGHEKASQFKGSVVKFDLGVSKNRGTPESSVLIRFSIIFTIHFGGPPLFSETPVGLPT